MSEIKEYELGSTIGGYRVVRRESLPNLDGTFYELAHGSTGARHIHIAVDDDNNCFAVAFPTIPSDSTGVPHILENSPILQQASQSTSIQGNDRGR